jgi:hypothetical protein
MSKGTLTVRLVEVSLTHDTEMFSEMDPYVVFNYNTDEQKSKIIDEGGKKAKWDKDAVFKFQIGNK